jgi:hypothetical protein
MKAAVRAQVQSGAISLSQTTCRSWPATCACSSCGFIQVIFKRGTQGAVDVMTRTPAKTQDPTFQNVAEDVGGGGVRLDHCGQVSE